MRLCVRCRSSVENRIGTFTQNTDNIQEGGDFIVCFIAPLKSLLEAGKFSQSAITDAQPSIWSAMNWRYRAGSHAMKNGMDGKTGEQCSGANNDWKNALASLWGHTYLVQGGHSLQRKPIQQGHRCFGVCQRKNWTITPYQGCGESSGLSLLRFLIWSYFSSRIRY